MDWPMALAVCMCHRQIFFKSPWLCWILGLPRNSRVVRVWTAWSTGHQPINPKFLNLIPKYTRHNNTISSPQSSWPQINVSSPHGTRPSALHAPTPPLGHHRATTGPPRKVLLSLYNLVVSFVFLFFCHIVYLTLAQRSLIPHFFEAYTKNISYI